jgi:sugar O-acyltransferase (sialic acid O-acetyltransferase NeuD family)
MSHDLWYVYGAGGLGVETMDILQNAIRRGSEKPHRLAFLVDAPPHGEVIGLPVVAVGHHVTGAKVTIAVGEPSDRAMLWTKVGVLGLKPTTIVSPDAFVSFHAQLGDGVIVAPHACIQATARIGRNVAINVAAIVGHDGVVKDDSVLSSMVNLGGGVVVEPLVYVGMGALVKERLRIGRAAIVGMGSVVYADVPDEMIAIGNPARVVRRNEDKKVFK